MQVTVKLFSYLRQITGTYQLSVDLAEKATVADLVKSLSEKFDGLSIKDEHTSIMVNHKMVFLHTLLKEGDQVLLLPIMEGG
jgi:molybdopterin converting factor small subunit